jgi:hypothetical protein
MRRFVVAALFAGAASAQVLVPPADVPRIASMLEPKPGEQTLRCSVEPVQPKLDYGFRFVSGYLLKIPLSEFSGTEVSGRVVLQVTPEGGGAGAYLAAPVELQPAQGNKQPDGLAPGVFFLGEGSYAARFAFYDGGGRVCRWQWRVKAHLNSSERSVKPALPSGGITDFPGAREATGRSSGVRIPRRLTVLLNANSPAAAIQLLETLLQLFPESEVRLVAFVTHGPPVPAASNASPDAKQILQIEGVKIDDLDKVARAIEPTQRWAVDYHDLANQVDGWNLVAELLHRETGRAPTPDLILFLGTREGFPGKMPPHFLEAEPAARRRVFYLQRAVNPGRPQMPAGLGECREGSFWEPEPVTHPGVRIYCPAEQRFNGFPDGIERAVARLKGQTLPFATPAEFSKAIDVIRKALAR